MRWGREQPSPIVEDRGGELSAWEVRRIPLAMAAVLTTREHTESTLSDLWPPYTPLDLPHCYARELEIPRTHMETMLF